MITPLISAAAMPGEKTNASLSFPEDELIACGIETIAEITLCLNIYDIGRYENLYRTGPITISTSAAEAFTQVRDDTGDVLYNENGVKIVYKQAAAGITGPSYALYIENNTDRRISVQTRDETVNGTSVRPGFTCYIGPGKAAIRSMEFLKSELTDNGILDVSEVKLKFVVYDNDSDDFDAIAVSGAVVIDP